MEELFGICQLKRVCFHFEKFERVFYLQGVAGVEFQGFAFDCVEIFPFE